MTGFSKWAELVLHKEYMHAEGRMEAFSLALKSDGDISVLQKELNVVRQRLDTSPDVKPWMAPHTSVRIYQEGYYAALKDAILLVRQLTAQEAEQA